MGMMYRALEVAEELAKDGISVEIVDPRTLRPMDTETIIGSVRKTHRAVVLEAGAGFAGMGSEIARRHHRERVRRSRRAGRARHRRERADAVREATSSCSRRRRRPRSRRRIRQVCNGMITKVVMPKLSDAMETGKVIKWLKKEGDRVKGGDILAEVETDKANVEIEAFGAGVLRKILVRPGRHGAGGRADRRHRGARRRTSSGLGRARAGGGAGARRRGRRGRRRRGTGGQRPAAGARAAAGARLGRARIGDRTSRCRPPRAVGADWLRRRRLAAVRRRRGRGRRAGGVKASPLARKIARADRGRPARWSRAAGPGGRIIRRDVEAARPPRPAAAPAARRGGPRGRRGRPAFAIPPRPDAEFEDVALTPDARDHRQAHAAVEGAGPALLRHLRGRDGPRRGRCARS